MCVDASLILIVGSSSLNRATAQVEDSGRVEQQTGGVQLWLFEVGPTVDDQPFGQQPHQLQHQIIVDAAHPGPVAEPDLAVPWNSIVGDRFEDEQEPAEGDSRRHAAAEPEESRLVWEPDRCGAEKPRRVETQK